MKNSLFILSTHLYEIGEELRSHSNIAFKYDCTYCDITAGTRSAGSNELFAKDGLHYAAEEYGKWALKVAGHIKKLIA